ncbi:MAG: hypothetical protein DLM68_03885 [Hyphomicrobiales bacterium]|nr:MAG: hypothetical protein DLM68_03885 [Hyphomicrobiales bacterium]
MVRGVIARSEATKQSRSAGRGLDCFASLTMTAFGIGSRQRDLVLASTGRTNPCATGTDRQRYCACSKTPKGQENLGICTPPPYRRGGVVTFVDFDCQ